VYASVPPLFLAWAMNRHVVYVSHSRESVFGFFSCFCGARAFRSQKVVCFCFFQEHSKKEPTPRNLLLENTPTSLD
jgi:hypothetical protein